VPNYAQDKLRLRTICKIILSLSERHLSLAMTNIATLNLQKQNKLLFEEMEMYSMKYNNKITDDTIP
jgi:hypothetical protein